MPNPGRVSLDNGLANRALVPDRDASANSALAPGEQHMLREEPKLSQAAHRCLSPHLRELKTRICLLQKCGDIAEIRVRCRTDIFRRLTMCRTQRESRELLIAQNGGKTLSA